ncbi:hypothetical protein HYQ46_000574 [Verticillium longisporum]|nr:hypothetical protein HYQ46_000574 [Verticillium longisporum]
MLRLARPAVNHRPTKISYDILLPEIRGALQGTLPYRHQGTSGVSFLGFDSPLQHRPRGVFLVDPQSLYAARFRRPLETLTDCPRLSFSWRVSLLNPFRRVAHSTVPCLLTLSHLEPAVLRCIRRTRLRG